MGGTVRACTERSQSETSHSKLGSCAYTGKGHTLRFFAPPPPRFIAVSDIDSPLNAGQGLLQPIPITHIGFTG